MPSGNISQESVKNINNNFSKSNVSSNRKFKFKKAPQVSLQPSHVIITISGSAARRQTMSQVLYSGDIFVRNVYREAMLREAVRGKRF
jgi:hypothetical protein